MSEVIAYHEAGHALIACLLGGEVQIVTIEPDDDDGPDREGDTQVLWRSGDTGKAFATKAVQVSLAGPVAEMIYSGDPYHPALVAEWAADWKDAWEAAIALHPDEVRRMDYLERTSVQLYHRLQREEMWAALAALADHLLAHETLEGEQVEEIVSEWLGGW
jgi:hypothetical protein